MHGLWPDANSTMATIRAFADNLDIAPGIVVGRLQHDKALAPHQQHGLRVRYQSVSNASRPPR